MLSLLSRLKTSLLSRLKTRSFILMTIACLSSHSCFTIKYSTTGASIPPEARTVSVQYFQNQANYIEAGLDQQFTDALKDYIQSNTNLVMVNGTGDIDFEGTIIRYETQPISIVSGDVASQNRFTISVRVVYNCYVDQDQDFESNFMRYEDYDSNLDFENVKNDLTDDIQKLLIEDIFNRAFVNW
jgi:hypothetical protein